MMTPTIIHGQCEAKLPELSEGSIELVVTSPPYDGLRTYGGNDKWDFLLVSYELRRVLVPGGILCWNVADETINGSKSLTTFKQAIHFVEKLGFRLHERLIYEKLNFSHPQKNRYHDVFEDVMVFTKGEPRCFNPIVDKRNATAGKLGNLGVNTFTERDGSKSEREKKLTKEFGMRHNVWKGKTRGQEEMCKKLPRTAMMPKWLANDLILSYSNAGDTVLDPFAGSGTVGKMALSLGRNAILIDSDATAIPVIETETNVTTGFSMI